MKHDFRAVVSVPAQEPQRTSSCQVTEWIWSRCGTVDKRPNCNCGIAQHAREQGYWEEEGFARNVRLRGSAGNPVGASLPTWSCDMDLGLPRARDNRRLEVVVDSLPLHGGVQLAVDTTLVSALKAMENQGKEPKRRKERE